MDNTRDKETEEVIYWQSRPAHERLAEATRLSSEAYGLKKIEEMKMDKTLIRLRFPEDKQKTSSCETEVYI